MSFELCRVCGIDLPGAVIAVTDADLLYESKFCSGLCKTTHEKLSVKIYDMDGGITWIAAKSIYDAARCHAENMGYGYGKTPLSEFWKDYPDTFKDAAEISKESYDKLKFSFRESDTPEREPITFRACLNELIQAGQKFPVFFATSEY